jgi:hypothetical protein
VAPVDRSLLIVGEEGELTIDDCWNYGAKIFYTEGIGSTLAKNARAFAKPGSSIVATDLTISIFRVKWLISSSQSPSDIPAICLRTSRFMSTTSYLQ